MPPDWAFLPAGGVLRAFAAEVREAMNKSPPICARARVGELAVHSLMCRAKDRGPTALGGSET